MKKKLAAFLSLAITLGLITGCRRKPVSAPAPPVPAPLPQPHAGLNDMRQLPAPVMPNVQLGLPPAPKQETQEHRHYTHPVRRHRVTETTPAATEKQLPVTTPSAGQEPTDATPIGRLSTAPATTDTHSYSSIQDEINSVQNGVNGIHRALSRSEQQTVTEIETFLAKARNALQTGDLDGAHTLTVKARVLLNEITR